MTKREAGRLGGQARTAAKARASAANGVLGGRPAKTNCLSCGGKGWVDGDDYTPVVQCPECTPR